MTFKLNLTPKLVDRTALIIGAIIFATAVVRAIQFFAINLGAPFFDWWFYAGAVDRWLSGAPIYPGQRISTLGALPGSDYAYPPASVPMMLPFASWPLGAVAWEILVTAALLFGTWAVVRRGWRTRPVLAYGVVLGLMGLSPGVVEGVAVGNVNVVTAGLLGFVWIRSRGVPTAAGVLGVIKVFPIALAAPLGSSALRRAVLVAGGICLITLPLVGLASWTDYVEGLRSSHPLCHDPNATNLSLACRFEPLIGEFAAKWAGLFVAGVCLVAAYRSGATVLGIAFAAGAVLAPATELHAHYWGIVFVVWLVAVASLNLQYWEWRSSRVTAGIPALSDVHLGRVVDAETLDEAVGD